MTLGRFAILFALLSAAIAVVGCSSDEDRLIDTIQADELATIFEPDPDNGYHWDGVQDPFFEGWYFNIKDPEQAIAFLFIYGIINPADHNCDTSQAFVYVVNAVSGEQLFKSYPVSDFSAYREYCDVVIAGNRATEVKIAGSIEEGGISARWSIDFDIEIEFPQIMGWLRHAVNLPIYWFVNAIKSWASGFILWNETRYDLDNAYGFNDHNWGVAFPPCWMWLRANHFPDSYLAFVAAGGDVPLSSERTIRAYLVAVHYGETLYTFRTPHLDHIRGSFTRTPWTLVAENAKNRLEVYGTAPERTLLHLLSPTLTYGMYPLTWESLQGTVHLSLYEKSTRFPWSWEALTEATAEWAGLDYGDLRELPVTPRE